VTDPGWAAYEAESRKLSDQIVVSSAEGTVASVRINELAEQQRAAWRRHRAAKGLVTRAMKDGSAEKIAAAQERERAAYDAADEIAHQGIAEMFALNRARLDAFGDTLDQVRRTWDAGDAALGIDREADMEAGQ
jgi:phage protein D